MGRREGVWIGGREGWREGYTHCHNTHGAPRLGGTGRCWPATWVWMRSKFRASTSPTLETSMRPHCRLSSGEHSPEQSLVATVAREEASLSNPTASLPPSLPFSLPPSLPPSQMADSGRPQGHSPSPEASSDRDETDEYSTQVFPDSLALHLCAPTTCLASSPRGRLSSSMSVCS